MSMGLLFNNDEVVMNYILRKYSLIPIKYEQAVGILVEGDLSGGVLFHNWNGFNVELSYYGEWTMTPGIIKCLARILVSTFKVSRVTVTVTQRNRKFIRSLQKLGFALEGVQRRFYGSQDTRRNTGVRLVMFRERLERLCQWPVEQEVNYVRI
jgi:RimJ/RimL family protein N-acetyltransferase